MPLLAAVLLAGGMSSRFGTDKSAFVPPFGGGDLLIRSLALLSTLPDVGRIAVSCRAEQADAMQRRLPGGTELLIDPQHEGTAPIFGILNALKIMESAVLFLPCDLPLMELSVLRRLCAAHAGGTFRQATESAPRSDAATQAVTEGTVRPVPTACGARPLMTAFRHADGHVESLICIREPESICFLERAISAGRYGLHAAVPAELCSYIPVIDERPFFNMNTQSDARMLFNGPPAAAADIA